MKRTIIVFSICSLFLFSCDKYRLESEDDHFIFGTSYGECMGDCATFFCMENEKLYVDNMDYRNVNYVFDEQSLSNSDYLLAKELFDNLPAYFRNHPNETFGCPDCVDQGGIYMEIKIDGVVEYWNVDTDVEQLPEEIREFTLQLMSVVDTLPLVSGVY